MSAPTIRQTRLLVWEKHMEHRWGRRQPTNLSVQFFAGPGTIGTGRLVNISATGAFMETTTPLRPLCIVNLGPLGLPVGESKTGSIAASVVRQNARGVGLEWCESAAGPKNVDNRFTALGGRIMKDLPPAYIMAVRKAGRVV